VLGVSVSEIHGYPLRPEGFEEPLFPTNTSRRTIVDHLSEAPWLMRASELKEYGGESSHALREPIELRNSWDRIELVRPYIRRRCSWRKKQVLKVLDHWREVRGWWDEDSYIDRMIFRVLLSGEAVVEIARERLGGWFLVGIVD
jgi:hypothetical protein